MHLTVSVNYQPTKNDPYTSQAGSSNLFTLTHAVVLENLLPSTEYHFQIQSATQTGSVTKTKDFMFNTLSQFPVIANGRVDNIKGNTVIFAWETNIPTNSTVRYTPIVNGIAQEANSATFGKPDFVTSHSITVSNLSAGATYNIELISTDSFGNSAIGRAGND